MKVFLWIFHGKTTRENPLAEQTYDFYTSCGKISMVNFQKESNVVAHIRETFQPYEECGIVKVTTKNRG